MQRKNVPLSEQRLILLDALSKLGSVTELQLLRFMVDSDLMDYFTFKLELSALMEADQVRSVNHPMGAMLMLTEDGSYALAAFEQRIPASRRETVARQAEELRGAFRSEQEMQLDAFTLSDKRQGLRLRLLEGDSALMDLSLTLENPQPEYQLRARWHSCAQNIYGTITAALSDGYAPGAVTAAPPPTAQLHQIGEHEWFLALQDRDKDPRLTLLLSLPTQDMGLYYAARWPLAGKGIAETILLDLTEG